MGLVGVVIDKRGSSGGGGNYQVDIDMVGNLIEVGFGWTFFVAATKQKVA